jgi:aminomethyltransferase
MNDGILKKTPLHDLHITLGARMVPFAGYEMPVQYPLGVMAEHLHTRSQAGLFDVSHMGQLRLYGDNRAKLLETLVTADVQNLPVGATRYTLFTNDNGGILDDLMVTNAGDHLYLVVNAACKDADIAHLRRIFGDDLEVQADAALIALQGPAAAAVMARLAPASTALVFMTSAGVQIGGHDCVLTRAGYTGEDGFEISIAGAQAMDLAALLLQQPEVEAIGLGARDSLRLEAGLCLYGHDIDSTTTPVEAGLPWAISKSRRLGGGFPGAELIQKQLAGGTARKRVGIRPLGRAPVREGAVLTTADGAEIGHITSGGYGPSVAGPVAMGYVTAANSTLGTPLNAIVRGKPLAVEIAALPFVAQNYHRR